MNTPKENRSMINDAARQEIVNWDNKQSDPPVVIRYRPQDHPRQKTFEKFIHELSDTIPSIRVTSGNKTENEQEPIPKPAAAYQGLPGFFLKSNIFYSAIPLERELTPFLTALNAVQSGNPLPDTETMNRLEQLPAPCSLVLYIAPQCPHCPGVVDTVIPLAVFSDKIQLTIIDGSLFPETAQKDRVMSAPCLILDNDIRWTGAVAAREIITMITKKDPSRLSAETLKQIMEEGDAQWITDQMIKKDAIFKGFMDLLLHETWSVRLGAMVVVESLAEERPDLAETLSPLLIREFDRQDVPVQGDILYALGQTGSLETKLWIKKKLEQFNHQDLEEAAKDAMEEIDGRC